MSPLATYLVESFVTLVAVVAIAIVVLLGARRLGIGRPHGPMRLVGRLPLDARRALYLVRVADQVLVLGASEAGLTKLSELNASALEGGEAEPVGPAGFSDLLARLRRAPPSAPSSADPSAKEREDV